MNNNKLENYISNLGWFGGNYKAITITLETGFEAFSGRATETWEQRVTIETCEIKNDDGKIILPKKKTVGKVYESITDVCNRLMSEIEKENQIDKSS